ncbi:MAG: hypothetical protein AAFR68_04145 [Pseudomonadota bacterium]
MTEEERKMLQDVADRVERVERFFFEAEIAGRPTRAAQLDDALTAIRTGKWGARSILWLAGALVTIAGALAVMRGWKP